MAISLDALTANVTALEAAAAAAVAALGTPGGPTQADVDALAARVKTVSDQLAAATAPKA